MPKIKKVSKSVDWAKNCIGITDEDLVAMKDQNKKVIYAYSVYPYGGGDDRIDVRVFNRVVPDELLQKFFGNSKIRGQMYGELCEIVI